MISAEIMRKRLRISHDKTDDEIKDNIKAARLDMSRAGVSDSKDNSLTDKAIELYCKAQFDYCGKGDQFQKNYEKLRDGLSLEQSSMEE